MLLAVSVLYGKPKLEFFYWLVIVVRTVNNHWCMREVVEVRGRSTLPLEST